MKFLALVVLELTVGLIGLVRLTMWLTRVLVATDQFPNWSAEKNARMELQKQHSIALWDRVWRWLWPLAVAVAFMCVVILAVSVFT